MWTINLLRWWAAEHLADSSREILVTFVLFSTWLRSMIHQGLAVSTVLLLESQYRWSSADSGFAMSCIGLFALVVGLIHAIFTAYKVVSDSLLLGFSGAAGFVGCFFFFDVRSFGPYILLLADGVVLAGMVVGQGILIGWARQAAKPHTRFSLESYSTYHNLLSVFSFILGPVISRCFIEFGSRNWYACLQVWFAACNLTVSMFACSVVRWASLSPSRVQHVMSAVINQES